MTAKILPFKPITKTATLVREVVPFDERLSRIKRSLEKINKLMAEVRKLY